MSIWLRWIFFTGAFVESSYRVEYWSLSHILNSVYMLGLMAPNACVQRKMRADGKVDMRLLLALSAIDAAALAFTDVDVRRIRQPLLRHAIFDQLL